jgi:hypothetical protein
MKVSAAQLLAIHTIQRAAWMAVETNNTLAACMQAAWDKESADSVKHWEFLDMDQEAERASAKTTIALISGVRVN